MTDIELIPEQLRPPPPPDRIAPDGPLQPYRVLSSQNRDRLPDRSLSGPHAGFFPAASYACNEMPDTSHLLARLESVAVFSSSAMNINNTDNEKTINTIIYNVVRIGDIFTFLTTCLLQFDSISVWA